MSQIPALETLSFDSNKPEHRLAFAVGTALLAYGIYTIVAALTSPLRAIPGPFWARFTRLWYLKEVWTHKAHRTNLELHKNHGPIVRIAPNEYSLDDPAACKILYGHGTDFQKGPWYQGSANGAGDYKENTFSERDPKKHAAMRRKGASLYTMSSLLKMEPAVDECIHFVQKHFGSISQNRQAVNLQWWMQCYAFDVIGNITVDKRFGFLDNGTDPFGLIKSLHHFLAYSARIGVIPELHDMCLKIMQLGPTNGFAAVAAFTVKQVKDYLARSEVEGDLMDTGTFMARLMKLHQEKPDVMSETDALNVCLGNVAAGSDTTSMFWGLMRNPEAYAKLRAEIDEKHAKGCEDPLSFADAQSMPYLQAVIKEALRLHPAGSLPLSRVVPDKGATISGQYFPKGTIVGINPWVAGRNADVFGDDPEAFKPERWLVSKEEAQRMDNYMLAFGLGSRTCLGKNIALLEMNKLVPQIVRNYDLSLVDPTMKLETKNVWFVQ
ncbi:hypothetical protein PFICI_03330 [Pestalotiopsis fici W106-1]|uniref:Pisatin demethylase n=1 Tax=Pestalotiopsis fici (strain W106-1 / CGMCC3.15140) TaxID=1229662 RepID=W3XH02_PESFW|nr:uncharacterized protein PFICI_03330 [Pestalotiopsis fici W106-1]ETS85305.1 hypothetical protein PFICI_03330 [Pestalotiopsis fici W106-1]